MATGRYCGHCGAAVDPRARFCGVCGARLGTPALAATGQPAAAQAMSPVASATAPPHASMPPVTGAVPVMPPGVAAAGGLSSTVVGRGRYVVERLLGRGGMSAVYVAHDTQLSDRPVAIKEMVDAFAD